MDAENKPVENVTAAASSAASDKGVARWRLILLVLCAVGAGLVIGVLALQVTEYRFYKAAPNVWPQSGAGGMVSASVVPSAKLSPVTTVTSSAAPAAAMGTTSAPVTVGTSMPAVVKP